VFSWAQSQCHIYQIYLTISTVFLSFPFLLLNPKFSILSYRYLTGVISSGLFRGIVGGLLSTSHFSLQNSRPWCGNNHLSVLLYSVRVCTAHLFSVIPAKLAPYLIGGSTESKLKCHCEACLLGRSNFIFLLFFVLTNLLEYGSLQGPLRSDILFCFMRVVCILREGKNRVNGGRS
jgi:hypothetical protein